MKEGFPFELKYNVLTGWYILKGDFVITQFKYIHDLQNIYPIITGCELEINV